MLSLGHDLYEDTNVTFNNIENEFNQDIAFLIQELTQPDKLDLEIKKLPRIERHNLLLEKLKNVSNNAKRIKYYDRLDNLSEVDLSSNECYGFMKKRYLQESYDIWRVLNEYMWFPQDQDELLNVIQDLAIKCKVDLK